MIQKPPCWMAYNTLGQEKQRERVTSFIKRVSLLCKVSPHCLPSYKVFLVPHECTLQRVYCPYNFGKMINFSYLLNIILIQDRNCNTAFSISLCMYLLPLTAATQHHTTHEDDVSLDNSSFEDIFH